MQDFDVKADDMEDMDNMHNSENQDQNIERNELCAYNKKSD